MELLRCNIEKFLLLFKIRKDLDLIIMRKKTWSYIVLVSRLIAVKRAPDSNS